MEQSRLAQLRAKKHWTLEEASERIGVSVNTLNRWEHGIQSPHGYNVQRLCDAYGISEAEALGRPRVLDAPTAGLVSMPPLAELWADDLLTMYARGIAACYSLYFEGKPRQVEDILPLYKDQTTMLARQPSPLQYAAARQEQRQIPILLFHGVSDTTAPITISDAFASTHSNVTYHRIPDAEHTQCWNANPQMYEAELRSFLTQVLD